MSTFRCRLCDTKGSVWKNTCLHIGGANRRRLGAVGKKLVPQIQGEIFEVTQFTSQERFSDGVAGHIFDFPCPTDPGAEREGRRLRYTKELPR